MLFGFLSLPDNWVYVTYSTGDKVNVANQDTLSQGDADYFKQAWDKPHKKVTQVHLETPNGETLKTYTY